MYYGNKTVKEMDDYYKINTDEIKYPWWQHEECEKIQQSFNNRGIMLTLAECKLIYEVYSDEQYCAGWTGGLDSMNKESIFKLLLPWLKEVIEDRVNRLTDIMKQLNLNGYLGDDSMDE